MPFSTWQQPFGPLASPVKCGIQNAIKLRSRHIWGRSYKITIELIVFGWSYAISVPFERKKEHRIKESIFDYKNTKSIS